MKYKELVESNENLFFEVKDRYYDTAMDINYYLGVKIKSKFKVEIIMNDILNMFLDYQEKEIPIENIVGSDIKEFCDEVIDSVGVISLKDRIFEFLYNNALIVIEIIILNFIFYGGEPNKFESLFTYKIGLHLEVLIFFIPLSVIFFIIRNLSRKYATPKDRKKLKVIVVVSAIALFIVLFMFFRGERRWVVDINVIIYMMAAISSVVLFFVSRSYVNNRVQEAVG